MAKELKVIVPMTEVLELLRLVTKIEMPDVTYSEDMVQMAQQAVRLSKIYAIQASEILYKWVGDNG